MEITEKYISLERIITKIKRDLRDDNISEVDVIEWVGEALDYLKMPGFLREAISFQEVKDYMTPLPPELIYIQQIARLRDSDFQKAPPLCDIVEECSIEDNSPCTWTCKEVMDGIPVDCEGKPLIDIDVRYYFPIASIDMRWDRWTKTSSFTKFRPVRKATSTMFFKELFKKGYYRKINEHEHEIEFVDIFDRHPEECFDEYKVTEGKILFSFETGFVAISYYKYAIDCESRFPLIPDDVRIINALSYYVKWKMAEMYMWQGRRDFGNIAQDMERKWLRYIKQAKTWIAKPKTLDDMEDLMEQQYQLVPIRFSYYDFFRGININTR